MTGEKNKTNKKNDLCLKRKNSCRHKTHGSQKFKKQRMTSRHSTLDNGLLFARPKQNQKYAIELGCTAI